MKYCEDCSNFILATQHAARRDQIEFACCSAFPRTVQAADQKRFVAKEFDIDVKPGPQYCTIARTQETMCGEEAKAFIPRQIP